MPFANTDMTQVMGIGSYMGEIRQGPDGQLYEWVHGVDGLGNPIGIWKTLKKVARGALKTLIPASIKGAARSVCGTINQLGPIVQSIPPAAPYYAAASGFCKVMRKVGIAGINEEPEAAAASVPAPTRSMARRVCGFIDKLGRIVRFIPPVAGPYQGLTKLCGALRQAGVAGVGDEVMEGPDGQLYEVVEGIGEFGEVKKFLRPVWLSIPAVIRPRRARIGRRPAVRGRPAVLAPAPGVPLTPVVPVAPVVTAPPAAPVRRFR